MIEEDTVKLLRECNSGIKMGVESIDEMLPKVKDSGLRSALEESRQAHGKLGDRTHSLLNEYHDEGKDPSPMAKGMSWLKTNMKMGMDKSDATIADLMTDGCNMGIKYLHKYLNQYTAADSKAKDICKRLISIEETLRQDLRCYL